MAADSVSQSDVLAMMRERGIDNGDELLRFASHARIAAACRWWDKRGAGPGVLAKKIREGGMAEVRPARSMLDEQKDYGEQIRDWLKAKLPEVCKPNPKVVAAHRRVYGDIDADKLATETNPHYAAVAAVIRIHFEQGKRAITVREHGPVIRAAVKAADQQAIADYEAIEAARTTSQQQEVAP